MRNRLKLTIGWTDMSVEFYADEGKSYTDSLYSQLKSIGMLSVWRKIKEDLFKKEGRKCWICGAKNTILQAHEFWKYFPIRKGWGKKKLIAIHHLCPKCHGIKHFDTIYLSEERANWERNLLKLCEKRTSESLKKGIENFLKNNPWRGEKGVVTKWRIREIKEYLKTVCPKKQEIEKELSKKRKLTQELIKHFCKVNRCSREIFEKHWEKVQRRQRKIQEVQGIRHTGAMKPNYGKYENLLRSSYKEYHKKRRSKSPS
jgi:hypothetical protein